MTTPYRSRMSLPALAGALIATVGIAATVVTVTAFEIVWFPLSSIAIARIVCALAALGVQVTGIDLKPWPMAEVPILAANAITEPLTVTDAAVTTLTAHHLTPEENIALTCRQIGGTVLSMFAPPATAPPPLASRARRTDEQP